MIPGTNGQPRADTLSFDATTIDQIVKYNLIMGFLNTPKSPPTLAEVDSLMCAMKKFFAQYLRGSLQDESLIVSLINIGYSYDPTCKTPMNVYFTIEATYSDGQAVGDDKIFRALRLGEDEILEIVTDYIWKSPPTNSIFHSVNQLSFESSLGDRSILPEGSISEATCSLENGPLLEPTQPSHDSK